MILDHHENKLYSQTNHSLYDRNWIRRHAYFIFDLLWIFDRKASKSHILCRDYLHSIIYKPYCTKCYVLNVKYCDQHKKIEEFQALARSTR